MHILEKYKRSLAAEEEFVQAKLSYDTGFTRLSATTVI